MLDSGSMSCTISVEAECKLRAAGVLSTLQSVPGNVVLIDCGGLTTQPECIYGLDIEVYGSKFVVPAFFVPEQSNELIIGSNLFRSCLELNLSQTSDSDCEQFLQLLRGMARWSGADKIGTATSCNPCPTARVSCVGKSYPAIPLYHPG